MPKLILRTPEEYTSFPILVDGTTYDIVTVEGPTTKTATISKATVAQLEVGNFGGGATDLTEVNGKIDGLTERLDSVDESIADIYDKISQLPTEMPSLEDVNTSLSAITNDLTDIKAQISALQARDGALATLIELLTAKVNALEGRCPCCDCTTTQPTTPNGCGCGC